MQQKVYIEEKLLLIPCLLEKYSAHKFTTGSKLFSIPVDYTGTVLYMKMLDF